MCDGFSEALEIAGAYAAANASTIAAVSSVAVSATGAIAQQDQARRSADTQADAINANNAQAHMDAQRASDELTGATAEQMSDRALDARKQLARIQVINGEGGGGVTGGRLEDESVFNAGQDQATIADNFKKQQDQLAFGGSAAARNADMQMASIKQPSTLGTGLTIAGAGLGAYNDYNKTQKGVKPNG